MKIYICPICNKTFDKPNVFNGHKAGHNTEANKIKYSLGMGKFQKDAAEKRLQDYISSPKKCKNCEEILPYSQRKNKFCSSSCSRKYTCRLNKKPAKKQREDYWKNKTIADIISTGTNKYNKIRAKARRDISCNNQMICSRCGYSKHVEVCHSKPISSFSLDTLISVVNDPSNIVLLCPNCHWEHDNL